MITQRPEMQAADVPEEVSGSDFVQKICLSRRDTMCIHMYMYNVYRRVFGMYINLSILYTYMEVDMYVSLDIFVYRYAYVCTHICCLRTHTRTYARRYLCTHIPMYLESRMVFLFGA